MVFNATFNNTLVISWWRKLACHKSPTDKLYHMLYWVHQTHKLVAIGTDCICSYKSNYHTTRWSQICCELSLQKAMDLVLTIYVVIVTLLRRDKTKREITSASGFSKCGKKTRCSHEHAFCWFKQGCSFLFIFPGHPTCISDQNKENF
jgi:hypothetical protein